MARDLCCPAGTKASATIRRTSRAAVVLLLLLAVGALVGMVPVAAAESPSPAADGEKVVLRVGLLEDADNLNPFIGYQVTSYMIWHLNYDFLVGFDPEDLSPAPGDRRELDDVRRRQDLDLHHPSGHDLAGRRARDRKRRRLHLQLHRRQRPREPRDLHQRHRRGGGDRRVHGRDPHRGAQSQHPVDGRPDPSRAHLVAGQRQGGGRLVPERAADHRLGTLQDGRVAEEALHPSRGQPRLLEGRAVHRRADLPDLH